MRNAIHTHIKSVNNGDLRLVTVTQCQYVFPKIKLIVCLRAYMYMYLIFVLTQSSNICIAVTINANRCNNFGSK